jgi:hypothetical protein
MNKFFRSVLFCFCVMAGVAQSDAEVDVKSWPGVFDPFHVATVYFEVDPADWEAIKHDTNYYDPVLNIRVPCLMWGEGETNKLTVQIRRKSDPALPNESTPQKVSLKIDINEYVDGQEWRGLKKLSLENGAGGNGVLREGMAMNLHRLAAEHGLYDYEAGYASWVRVIVNGSYVGLYSSPEQRDKQFLRNRGMYKPGASWIYEVNGGTTLDTTIATTNSPTYNHLCYTPFRDSCSQPNLETDLPQWVDMRGMLAFGGIEAFVGNNDGLFTKPGKNSFAVDMLPSTDQKRRYIPWDLDAGMTSTTWNIYTGGGGTARPYQTEILAHYWYRQVYRHIVTDLLDGPLSTANLTAFLNRLEPILTPYLNEDPNGGGGGQFSSLRQYFTNRIANVRTQVGEVTGWPRFNQAGGEIISGFQLTLTHTNGTGTIYYTLDGSDPRAVGGAATGVAYSGSITLTNTAHVMARVLKGTNWSQLREATFNLEGHASSIRITEIMYNPKPTGTNDDASEYEFIELKNTGTSPVDLSNCYFDGIGYRFKPKTIVAAGACVLLVRNPAAFAARYPGVSFDGVYFGGLSANGEKIRLKNSDGNNIFSVEYDNNEPWPKGADGLGYSLVPLNPSGNLSDPENWRESTNINGSPGATDPAPPYSVGVVVNEVLAHTDTPLEDAIELYNTTGTNIDIGGWYLSDNLSKTNNWDSLKKYKIPAGTIVPAHGYKVFYEGDFNGSGSAAIVKFAFSKSGEEVYLSSADASGNLTGHIVGFEFGASDNPVTFGRYPTSRGPDLTFLASHTFGVANPTSKSNFRTGTGLTNSGAKIGPVVVNEIMYNPTNGGTEFIELHNLSGTDIDLGGWVLGGASLTFATNTVITANGFVVIAGSTNITPAQFRAENNVPAAVPVICHNFDLQNDGERLELSKVNEDPIEPPIVVDHVRYNDEAPWPTEADREGPSLERFSSSSYGNDPLNWRTTRHGGSPGRSNSNNSIIAVARNSSWQALDLGWNLGTPWTGLNYSSSGWTNADGVLGYGQPFVQTILTNAATNRPVTIYLRKEFVVNDEPSSISQLLFSANYDDGFVAYFNGQEIARRSIAGGTVNHSTLASAHAGGSYENLDLTSERLKLVRGKNVLAVELHQESSNSSDAVWDADLLYTVGTPLELRFTSIARLQNGHVQLTVTGSGNFSILSSPDLAEWNPLTNVVLNGSASVTDSQASPSNPRFYKAVSQ